MKRIMITMVGMLILSLTTMAQNFEPYVNGGLAVTNNVMSYTGEVGIYSNSSWYALGLSRENGSGEDWSVSTKGYWKVSNRRKAQLVDLFATAAVNMTLTRDHLLSVEPGVSAVYNINRHWAPQVSLSFPIQQNEVFRSRGLTTTAGLSLNYFF